MPTRRLTGWPEQRVQGTGQLVLSARAPRGKTPRRARQWSLESRPASVPRMRRCRRERVLTLVLISRLVIFSNYILPSALLSEAAINTRFV